MLPPGWASVPLIKSVAAQCAPRAVGAARRAWRLAAPSLRTSPTYLEAFCRRMRSQRGPANATTATAHKLAKMLYHMFKEKTPSRERGAEDYLHKDDERKMQQ